jgi:hypothetical protein
MRKASRTILVPSLKAPGTAHEAEKKRGQPSFSA